MISKSQIEYLYKLAEDIQKRADKKLEAMNKYDETLDPRAMRLEGQEMRLRLQHAALIALMKEAGVISD